MKRPEILEVFREDLKTYIQQLEESLERSSDEIQKEVREVAANLKSASLIIHEPSFEELGVALDLLCKEPLDKALFILEVKKIASLLTEMTEEKEAFSKDLLERILEASKEIRDILKKKKSSPIATNLGKDPAKSPFLEFTEDTAMVELFQAELENQSGILSEVLLEMENGDYSKISLMLRAAHSIKGAFRIVHSEKLGQLAHALEDWLIRKDNERKALSEQEVENVFGTIDLFAQIGKIEKNELAFYIDSKNEEIDNRIKYLITGKQEDPVSVKNQNFEKGEIEKPSNSKSMLPQDRVLKVTAQNLNRLMGLAGETVVESNWLFPFKESLFRIKKHLNFLSKNLDLFRASIGDFPLNEWAEHYLLDIYTEVSQCRTLLSEKIADFETYINRHANLSDSLYREVIDSRMRPFSDGTQGFSRLVRDLSKELKKKVRLEMKGLSTPVDREILEKLEGPLVHLVRNSVDHGIESPEQRLKQGKSEEGTIRIEAQQKSGMFVLTVSDDGAGIDLDLVKSKILANHLASIEILEKLQTHEIFEFLMLPGFSTAKTVTEISGRGVGLNVVRNVLQEIGGGIQITSQPGKGTTFCLQLPLTLSVIRALLVEVAGEPYAFPLVRIERTLSIPKSDIQTIENKRYYNFEGQNIGLIAACEILELGKEDALTEDLSVVVITDRNSSYGIIVDRFLGGREFVVEEIDSRLGKVPDISSGAFMEDGTPVFILDIEDLVRSSDHLLSEKLKGIPLHISPKKPEIIVKKKILLVDDSITVREAESRLLSKHGYEVETAFNGMDGWNAVRSRHFDLVITDVDMPRMNGIELVRAIRNDTKLKSLPVMIVSYKEDENDKKAGKEAGANYYLTKSSFHDDTLIAAVEELIGKAVRI